METDRELVCVLMPAVVQDEERALQCLGGLRNISEVYSNPGDRRLGLCLSPANPYASQTFADATEGGGLLLSVRVRRRRSGNTQPSIVSTRIFGYMSRTYKFDCLVDFTLTPVNAGLCIQEQLVPSGRESSAWLEVLGPTLLPPPHFARSDRPLQYCYTDKKIEVSSQVELQHHLKTRPERPSNVVHIDFSLNVVIPSLAAPASVRALQKALTTDSSLQDKLRIIEEALSERPIWSRSSLQLHTGLDARVLKLVLPARAFHMRSGPWRLLWLRVGYDPRLDSDARRYQTLDYRLRNLPEVNLGRVTNKHKGVERVRRVGRSEPWGEVNEAAVRFKPGVLPGQRQIYYQYCDIEVEEVQRLVEEGVSQTCDETRGWLRPGVERAVRDVMSRLTRTALHQVYGGTSDGAESSSLTPTA